MDPQVVLPVILGTALGYVVAPAAAIAAAQSRGPRCVRCPENGQSELVRIGMARAVASLFTGGKQRLIDCTRWPAHAGCSQACATQLS
jgi:hypothetical protein